ncbi:MAG: putative RND superfamily exporter protein [Gammaproteobacteria bacterium]|jgi:predicted RND superfamily exporter protein
MMSTFEAQFATWVIRNRWRIIPCTVILLVIAISGLRHLYFDSSYRVFFGPQNPQRIAFEALEDTYVKNDNLVIAMAPANGKIFTRESLTSVEELTKQAWQIPYSNRVDSITNYQHTYANGDDLIVEDLVKNAVTLSDGELDRIRRTALNEPLLRSLLIRDDSAVTAVIVNIQLPGLDNTKENAEVISFARNIAREIEAKHPGTKIYLTGNVMMNNAFPEATKADLETLIPLSFGVMMLLLMWLVGGVVGTLAAMVVFTFSIAGALGIAGYIGFPMTPVSASAPTIILTVAIANCVHVLISFLFGMRHALSKTDALEESLRINLQPICIASGTTVVGFLTLNFSEVPPFQDLGNIVAIGVAISFFLSVTLLPALIAVLPVRTPEPRAIDDAMMVRLGNFVVHRRRQLLWGMTIGIVVLVANLPRNELNDVFLHWFSESIQFRSDTDFVLDNLTGLYTTEYSLRAEHSGGISNPNFLREVEDFSNWLRAQPGVRHVRSITDIIKRLNKNLHGDDTAMYHLPKERELAAQYLLLYELSLPYGLDLNNQINVDKSSVRVTATLDVLSTNEILALNESSDLWLRSNAEHIDALPASGAIVMFANIASRNIRAMLIGTTIALVLISLILIAAFRSTRIGLISLLPNLAPAAMGFGIWGIFVGEVGLSLSIVMSVTLGIVIDDTVHFLSKYLRARREMGLDSPDAVRYAFKTVGRALLTTSVILTAGFLILGLSNFVNNSTFGILTAIVIVLALITDFLFLPPLLMKMESRNLDGKSAPI